LERVNQNLAIEGLEYKGRNNTLHILEVLEKNVDLDYLKESIKYSLEGKKIASHYGCHALRPSNIIDYIDSETPQIMEEFIVALGATCEYYPEKLDCCGSTLTAANYESSFQLSGAKIEALQKRNYDALVTVCPFCQKMYDGKQEAIKRIMKDQKPMLPVFYLPQLIGIALGLDNESLGLNFNATPIDDFLRGLN
jgi:heterodisulfide reductase subunit B